MTCDLYPNCHPIDFIPGENTKKGGSTHQVVCAGGILGGCDGQNLAEINQFDSQAGSQTPRRQAPIQKDELGRAIIRAWEEPLYLTRDKNNKKAGRQ